MKPNELRKFTKKELIERLSKTQEELTTKQLEVRLGKDADTADLKDMRREIARINTILNEKSYVKSADDEVVEVKKVEPKKEVKKVEKKEAKKVKIEKKVKKEKVEKKPVKKAKVEKKTKTAKAKKVTKTKKK